MRMNNHYEQRNCVKATSIHYSRAPKASLALPRDSRAEGTIGQLEAMYISEGPSIRVRSEGASVTVRL
jgi:hypothetical protein